MQGSRGRGKCRGGGGGESAGEEGESAGEEGEGWGAPFFPPLVKTVKLFFAFCHLPLPALPNPGSLLTAFPRSLFPSISVCLRGTPGQLPTP